MCMREASPQHSTKAHHGVSQNHGPLPTGTHLRANLDHAGQLAGCLLAQTCARSKSAQLAQKALALF